MATEFEAHIGIGDPGVMRPLQMRDRLGANPVPVQVPIGAEDSFEGVVDLVSMQALYWDDRSLGTTYEARNVPGNLEGLCQDWREKMVEAAAEADEALLEKYLESAELTEEEIRQGLRTRTLNNEIVIAMCGSAPCVP